MTINTHGFGPDQWQFIALKRCSATGYGALNCKKEL